jgi:hypothetical protein
VLFAILLFTFALGFFLEMRQVIGKGKRRAWLVLFLLTSVGIFNTAIFPAASRTAVLHWTIGFLPTFLAPMAAYFVAFQSWRQVSGWRGLSWYSLFTALGIILLTVLSFVFLAPRSSTGGPSAPIGGLIERILVLVTFAWPVVIGWRLFVLAKVGQPGKFTTRSEVGA